MPCITAEELRSLTRRLFEALRVPAPEAAWVAELLVRADLAGHEAQGVRRIPQYVQALRSNLANPQAQFEITQDAPAIALIDGHGGLGQVVARGAMELAIRKARATKISSVGAYNLYHLGRLADYTRLAAEQELVGIMTVKTGGASPLVAPLRWQRWTVRDQPAVHRLSHWQCCTIGSGYDHECCNRGQGARAITRGREPTRGRVQL